MDGAENPDTPPKKRRRPTPQELADGLVTLLDVEELDVDLYRGPQNPGGKGRVFGGQVIAQALMSAVASVDSERVAHSLHAYFMRPGDENFPIIYRVERDYDGGSFSNRRVIAMQRGKPILNMTASFHRKEGGLEHQADMPDVPAPETLPTEAEHIRKYEDKLDPALFKFLARDRPIEIRPVEPWSHIDPEPRAPARNIWFKASGDIGDDPLGWIVENAVIRRSLAGALQDSDVRVIDRTVVERIKPEADHTGLILERGRRLEARLVVAADG